MKNQLIYLVLLSTIIFSCKSKVDNPPFFSEDSYHHILNGLDPENMGKGIDIFNNDSMHRPMAYGLILSAETNRFKHSNDSSALSNARKCASWLLKNTNLDNDSILGYGIPDAWDAFTDGSINNAHEEYTITTSLALDGLLDLAIIEKDSLMKNTIIEKVAEILFPFVLGEFDSPAGIPAYSTCPPDRNIDMYNPAAHLSGVMNKLAQLTYDPIRKNILLQRSKSILDIIFSLSKKSPENRISWPYGSFSDKTNDLVHTCYIIEGYRAFNKGKNVYPLDAITSELNSFKFNGQWNEYNHIRKKKTDSSRLWALGMLVYSLSLNDQRDLAQQTLENQISEYKDENGRYQFRLEDDRIMVRQETHLLLGLSHYLWHD